MARHRQRVAQLGHALRRARHRQRPVGVVPDVDAGERREPLVEVAAVARELCLHVGAAGARHEPGGVPAGAARDPAALEDDGVGPAQPGEVVGDGGADDAAADDDRPRSRGRSLGGPRVEVGRLHGRVAEPFLRGRHLALLVLGECVSADVLPAVRGLEADRARWGWASYARTALTASAGNTAVQTQWSGLQGGVVAGSGLRLVAPAARRLNRRRDRPLARAGRGAATRRRR